MMFETDLPSGLAAERCPYFVVTWMSTLAPLVMVLSTVEYVVNRFRRSMLSISDLPAPAGCIWCAAALDTLARDYGVDRRVPDLVIPFGIFAKQHGAIFLLSFLTVFLAQIYVINLGIQDYVVISIGSIIAGATSAGE